MAEHGMDFELFAGFVLVERLSDPFESTATFRALDLSRALRPQVVLERVQHEADYRFFDQVRETHEGFDSLLMSEPLQHGMVGEFMWRTRTWLPGLPLSTLRATIEPMPLEVGLTLAYLITYAISDGLKQRPGDSSDGVEGRRWHGAYALVAYPSRLVVSLDGNVRVTRPGLPQRYADLWHAPGIVGGLRTPQHITPANTVATVVAALLGSQLPAELTRVVRKMANDEVSISDFASELQPIMEAAGGGSYATISRWLRATFVDLLEEQTKRQNAELELAHRMREAQERRRRAGALSATTMRLRIRPASQEEPARLERVAPVPQEMVLVSGGRYLFSAADDAVAQEPYVDLKPFLLDKTPITWVDYARFCQTGKVSPPTNWPVELRRDPRPDNVPEHLRKTPVTGISHEDASAFARFVDKRLPTEAEWELAARGFDGRVFPYGHEYDEQKTGRRWQRAPDGAPDVITEEDLLTTSPFGVALLGYAWEWTSTPAGDLQDTAWVVRGGVWRDTHEPPSLLNRSHERSAAGDVTFRCARDFDADAALDDAADADEQRSPPVRIRTVDDTDEGDAVRGDTDEGSST